MATPCFYHPSLTVDDEQVHLLAAEASHAIKSRRLQIGQNIRLINGQGLVADAVISQMDRRNVIVTIVNVEQSLVAPLQLHIAVAIPKGDRQKVMIDMLSQLGVNTITPLICEHSVTRFSDNLAEKWQRVAIEACKQSQNPWLPTLNMPQTLEQIIEKNNQLLAYTDVDGDNIAAVCGSEFVFFAAMTVVIGPEGGFSPSELSYLRSQQLNAICLSGSILRTETAAVSVASQFNQIRLIQAQSNEST